MTSTSLDAAVGIALHARRPPGRLRVEHLREAFGITATAPRLASGHQVVTIEGGDHRFFGAEDQMDTILATAVDYFSRKLGRP